MPGQIGTKAVARDTPFRLRQPIAAFSMTKNNLLGSKTRARGVTKAKTPSFHLFDRNVQPVTPRYRQIASA